MKRTAYLGIALILSLGVVLGSVKYGMVSIHAQSSTSVSIVNGASSPSISSAAANQLAEQYKGANNPSNPFKVNPITLVYIAYAVIFGIPIAAGLTYFLYRKRII